MSIRVTFTLTVLALLLLCASAAAALPAHPRLPALDVEGLNHACGVAVDSKGDLYASSAAASKVEVFSPADHTTPIGEVANANEPCGLALTSKGVLYVSERATGEVVRYKPSAYPFVGAPSYGPREVVDPSGQADGISVDPSDDRLYVAEGTRVSAYDSEGKLGRNETQQVRCTNCTGGKYEIEFKGEPTKEINFEGEPAEVKAALEELASIDPGDVSVLNGSNKKIHLITFEGKYAHTDLEALKCIEISLEGASHVCGVTEPTKGWSGLIGEGSLTEATGVAAYTYKATPTSTVHLAVADASGDQVKLFSATNLIEQKLRRTLEGAAEGEEFGFGAAGAYLAADPGTCPPAGGRACTAGHFFLYDDEHEVLDEFEADGALISQTPFAFGDGGPTAIAVDRSGGAGNGSLYATTGKGTGARALSFSPLSAPSHPGPLAEPLSLKLEKACAIAVDSHGNRYVAVGPEIKVYGPNGSKELAKIASGVTCRIGVDSEGNVYALLKEKEAVYYKPSSFPPVEGTTYGAPTKAAEQTEFEGAESIRSLAVNPANDHLLLTSAGQTIEYKSAKEGSKPPVNTKIGAALGITSRFGVGAYGANGDLYITTGGVGNVFVLDPEGKEVLTRINGLGSPAGSLGTNAGAVAIDQSNGHAIVFEPKRKNLQEYESSGTYVTSFGAFEELVTADFAVAVDNGALSPNKGTVYLAYDDPVGAYDLWAFGGLEYPGLSPTAITGAADGLALGEATLHGTVNPNGSPLIECAFEYLTLAQYEGNGGTFAGAQTQPCAESLEGIGAGSTPVPVSAQIEGLALESPYRFRLVAANASGAGEGESGAFTLSPPLLNVKDALPVTYTEATLRSAVNPVGAPTAYHFEYLTQAQYEANGETFTGAVSTPAGQLPAGEGFVAVEAPLSGLAEGTEYRFRLVAENDVGDAQAEGPPFQTLELSPEGKCENAALRTGLSAGLPDCRAYELVTPGRDGGYPPFWAASFAFAGNFATSLAAADGQSLIFETEGPLPGTNGNGVRDGYQAAREPGGWESALYGPVFAQTGFPNPGGVSTDQGYSFWSAQGMTGSLDPDVGSARNYLALPQPGVDPDCSPEPSGRFELIGCGSEGADPEAIGRWISPGASHVIFTSDMPIEPNSPAEGTTAIYDRSPGGPIHVVSLLPGDVVPGASVTYEGVSADGSAVAYSLAGVLYVRRDNAQTLEVDSAATFAGLARDGSSLFYKKGSGLYRYDAGEEESTEIAPSGSFVNVAADGTRVYFVVGDELELWEAEGDTTQSVATLDPSDLEGPFNLAQWVQGLDPDASGTASGPAIDPSRSTPDGKVLIFQSHADLTGYDADGHSEIFRYDAAGGSLTCVSCGVEGTTAASDAKLQDEGEDSPIASALAPIANLSEDGDTAFFTSAEALLPADENGVADVYEWRDGVLSLISTGKSRFASILYAVSPAPSGHDVFFATRQALVPQDVEEGSRSIYDARVEGGFSAPTGAGNCEGEGCAESPTAPPELNPPPQTTTPPGKEPSRGERPPKCPKGKHKVKKAGKVRCVKPHKKHHHAKKHHRQGRAAR